MRVVTGWSWRVKAASVITLCYGLLWMVRFTPPRAALFFWQRGAWGLAIMLGLPVFVVVVCLLAMESSPGADSRILLVLLGVVGLGCNLMCDVTVVDWLGISVKPAEQCKVFASDENGLRVTLYRETLRSTFDYGGSDWSFTFTDNQAHIFLENTTDGGDSWTQTAYYTDQAPDDEDFCYHVQAVGDTFFVVAIGETVLTSRDNGAQWNDYKLVAGFGDSYSMTESRIAKVEFADPKHGTITFEWYQNTFDYGYHAREIILTTNDGGQTWSRAE